MKLVKKGKTYYYRARVGNVERLISTHKTNEREALTVARVLQDDLHRHRTERALCDLYLEAVKMQAEKRIGEGMLGDMLARIEARAMHEAKQLVDRLIPAPPLTAADIFAAYLKRGEFGKASSEETKRQRWRVFADWAGDRDLRDFGAEKAAQFVATLDCSELTKKHYVSALSTIWRSILGLVSPWSTDLIGKVTVHHKKPLTLDQIGAAWQYAQDHHLAFWSAAIPIAYYAGGRRLKELVYFNADSIRDGYVDLIPEKTATTSGKRVRVPICKQLGEVLNTLHHDDRGYFFPEAINVYEKSRATLSDEFRRILAAIGVSGGGYGVHSIRHSYVTEAVEAGIAPEEVAATAGHSALSVTMGTYYHGIRDANIAALPVIPTKGSASKIVPV